MKRLKLDELNKKVPFKVPEDYFDRLTVDIQSRIPKKKQILLTPTPQWKWALVSAAMLTLVAVFWMYSTGENEQPTADMILAQVDEEALIDYLDMNEFSEADLFDGVENNVIDNLWGGTEVLDELELETEDLDELLMDYDDNINS